MNRSSVTYEPEEGDMKFSEHDRKIIGSKVAKATFKGGVSRLKGKGGEKSIIPLWAGQMFCLPDNLMIRIGQA